MSVSDIKLNKTTGDIELLDNDLLLLTANLEIIEQNLRQRLRVYFGEWFLDQSEGIPYFQQIFVKKINPVVVDAAIKNVILNTVGVLQLTEFDMSVDSSIRELTVTFKVITETGELSFEEVFS